LGATQAVATLAPAAHQAAQAAWARKIQSRIARHQVFPRGVRGQGRVRLQMDILADGRLGAVRVDRSSGVAAFDKAAVRAARAAAPFPPAPEGLRRARYAFAQWVSFSR
jgi:protein TonB